MDEQVDIWQVAYKTGYAFGYTAAQKDAESAPANQQKEQINTVTDNYWKGFDIGLHVGALSVLLCVLIVLLLM